MDDAPIETVLGYHERTKHHVGRFARALGYLDWETQPDPFRRYAGATTVELPEAPPEPRATAHRYDALWGEPLPPRPLDRASLAQLFYDSLALSAWKSAGRSRWSVRVNPSSGNLHPTEGYALLPAVAGAIDAPALVHYAPREHALEVRRRLDEEAWLAFARAWPEGSFLVGLTSIVWREAWKYGERAFRYCQHDVGHALGALAVSARVLGWSLACVDLADDVVARLLDVHAQHGVEAEHPDLLAVVSPAGAPRPAHADSSTLAALQQGASVGVPNALSAAHHEWPILASVADAARMHRAVENGERALGAAHGGPTAQRTHACPSQALARHVIRTRRSALGMDGSTRMSRAAFLRMLETTLPEVTPWVLDLLPTRDVHLLLFVHRVDDLEPGLYLLPRSTDGARELRTALGSELAWETIETLAGAHPLVRLAGADVRHIAKLVSCDQDIAADGVLALAMLARFEPVIRARGPAAYRWLHWEAGAIGQLLYLEAEALGLRATGIGCFFDDLVHELLGLGDRRFQSLYHFTVGGPTDDPRIQSLPAHPDRASE